MTESSWWDTLRPAVLSAVRIWSGVSRHWTHLEPRGRGAPQGFNPPRRVRFITKRLRRPFLRECQRVPRHFWECLSCLGYDPARPTWKRPCATLVCTVGRLTNTEGSVFNSYYAKVWGRALLRFLNLLVIRTLWCWELNKEE